MTDFRKPSLGLLIVWHILALALLALALPYLRFKLPLWSLKANEFWPMVILLGTYAVCACLPGIARLLNRPVRLGSLAVSIVAVFGLVFLYFLITQVDSKRIIMLQVLCGTLLLVPLGLRLGRFRAAGVALLAIGVAGLLVLSFSKDREQAQAVAPHTDVSVVRTEFYNVRTVSYVNFIPEPAVRGGGIAKLGKQFLLMSGDGHLYLLDWAQGRDDLTAKPLPYRVPVNGDEFAKDTTGAPWHKPREGDALSVVGEDAGSTVITWWFRAAGLLVQEQGEQLRVFASHYYWKHDTSCWVERVSVLETSRAAFILGNSASAWRTVFETQPCLPIKGEGRRRGTPFAGHFGGGRMILRDSDTVLLTVGDFGFNGVSSSRMLSQDMNSSYGKTILIHLNSGTSEIYTSGNRNPQGLYQDPDGTIWDTEHGPQGGDELNLIQKGKNYGWPIVTYGVDYGTFAWPLNPRQGEHDGFEAPFYAWIPSIGASDLIGVTKDLFPVWKGDLLVSSLVAEKVFRVRIRNDRVAYEEPIEIGRRIRDIAEGDDGRIVLWADDDNAVVSLKPEFGNTGQVAFATYCSGCHKVGDGTSHRIGPDLWGILGRKVASAGGYADYSASLRAYGGTWTEERFNNFIKNPQAAVPGTAMEFAGVEDANSRTKILDFLKHAPKVISK